MFQVVYHRVRSDIIYGALPPGQQLNLEHLQHKYDTSVSTLREVMMRLATERFVANDNSSGGFSTTPVSADNLVELANLRKLLEYDAMEQSFRHGDKNWEADVIAAHERLRVLERSVAAGEKTERSDWRRHDFGFHQALIKACQSPELMAIHTSVIDKYLRYQMLYLTYRGEIAAKEHLALREAALSRDIATAKRILGEHIDGGVEHALESHKLGRFRVD